MLIYNLSHLLGLVVRDETGLAGLYLHLVCQRLTEAASVGFY